MSEVVLNNGSGVNSKLVSRAISRLFCGYGNSTSETVGTLNLWQRFPTPSVAMQEWRNVDFATPTDNSFIYQGVIPRWFKVVATCNVLKAAGGLQSRTIELVWRLNGVDLGAVRQAQMNTDSSIVTGYGECFLTAGDVLEPWIRNVENDDPIRLFNCSFGLTEDYVSTFIIE